jgi:hypothetical protein
LKPSSNGLFRVTFETEGTETFSGKIWSDKGIKAIEAFVKNKRFKLNDDRKKEPHDVIVRRLD